MAKITVESLAKQLKVSSQEVLKCLESIGVFVPNAKATMELDEIRKVCVKLTGKEPRFKRPASKTAAQAKPVKTAEKKENPAKEEEKTVQKEAVKPEKAPEETVKRARSRIGERSFNLGFNNCEYFAVWCKTGVSQSYQVNLVLDAIFIKGKVDII